MLFRSIYERFFDVPQPAAFVVDDEIQVRTFVSGVLHLAGYMTHQFGSAADVEAASGDAEAVRQAFEELKTSEAFRMRVSERLSIEPRPLIEGNQIRLAPHVIERDLPPTRYLHGIDMVAVLELAPGVSQVPDLFEAYARRHPPPSLHDFLMAVSEAVARGWVVAQ